MTAWTADSLRVEIEAFLAAHHTVTIATIADDGSAHANNLLYVPDGLGFLWTSDSSTRHSSYIKQRTRIEATIAPDYSDFALIRGLQIVGQAQRLAGTEALRAQGMMVARYSFLAQLAQGPAKLLEAWRKAGFYRLAPESITLIDNTRGFGHKATLAVDATGAVSLA